MSGEPAPQRRRGRPRTSRGQDPTSRETSRPAYRDLAARTDVLSWSKGTFAEREGWLWDEVWALARAQGRPAPPRRPLDQVPQPDESSPVFPEGSRRAYRDLVGQLRRLAVLSDDDFAAEEIAAWATLWVLAEQRGITEPESSAIISAPMDKDGKI